MSDIASPGSGASTSTGGGATAQVQEKAQEVAGQAKEQAQQAAGQAQDRVRGLVDERSTQAGQQVTQQARDLRTVGDSLREQGKDGPAKLADQAAERAERMGAWLEDSDADTLLQDIEDFGRRQPWAIALGGLALGFAASRFLKASSTERYQGGGSSRSQLATRSFGMDDGERVRRRPVGNGLASPSAPSPAPATGPATEWPAPPTPTTPTVPPTGGGI